MHVISFRFESKISKVVLMYELVVCDSFFLTSQVPSEHYFELGLKDRLFLDVNCNTSEN